MKILVVDDEKVLVKGIKFNLENEGYQVTAAYDGASAVDLARRERFDLIILDHTQRTGVVDVKGAERVFYDVSPFKYLLLNAAGQ